MTLTQFEEESWRCRTPQQFMKLLTALRDFIPYLRFCGVWGYPSRSALRYYLNDGFPFDLIRWYFATGAMWTSPIFHEWLATNTAFLWSDAADRLRHRIDPELVRRVVEAGVQCSLCGGSANLEKDYFIGFALDLGSESQGRHYLPLFNRVLPSLVDASERAYPAKLLTKRETVILERRAMGEIVKQIAQAEEISERTVREHLQHIKKKLHTNDLVHAVVIALRQGMALPARKH